MTYLRKWASGTEWVPYLIVSTATFLLPALALWVRSGYSYAATLLLVGTFCFFRAWSKTRPDMKTLTLVVAFVLMGVMWSVLSLDLGIARFDKGAKWILGALCLLFLNTYRPEFHWFRIGLPIGGVGMGVMAIWQIWGQGLARAHGYTNAIQWGNIGMMLACVSCACLIGYGRHSSLRWRLLMILAIAGGVFASLLSKSRGGWLVPLVIIPLALYFVRHIAPQKFKLSLIAFGIILIAFLSAIFFTPTLHDRSVLAVEQVQRYVQQGRNNSSLGVRLQQYELAVDMILEKPWLGWGPRGFVEEVSNRVESGEYSSRLVRHHEIHNDFIDVWIKIGIIGLFIQIFLYGWVLYIFWPTKDRLSRIEVDSKEGDKILTVRLMGSLVPVCYLVFGLTQPFFNHNSGIMNYVFYTGILWAVLQRLEHGEQHDAA